MMTVQNIVLKNSRHCAEIKGPLHSGQLEMSIFVKDYMKFESVGLFYTVTLNCITFQKYNFSLLIIEGAQHFRSQEFPCRGIKSHLEMHLTSTLRVLYLKSILKMLFLLGVQTCGNYFAQTRPGKVNYKFWVQMKLLNSRIKFSLK